MIIALLLSLISGLFSLLLSGLGIPGTPDGLKEVIAMTLDYLGEGLSILAVYVDLPYLLGLFMAVKLVDGLIAVWNMIMFLIKKIPLLGIK